MPAEQLITQYLSQWATAIKRKPAAGRGSSRKVELYGIKKLRELILELAVRGLLVPQDPKDEHANKLLEMIAVEKTKLVKDGKIKRDKPPLAVGAKEQPFQLPKGWAWCRLGTVAQPQAGFAFKAKFFNEIGQGLPLIRIRDVGQPFSGTYCDEEYREEFLVEEGDYLVSMDGNFRVAPWKGKSALLNQRVSRLIFYSTNVAKRFVAESLQRRLLALQGVKSYTTVDHLSGGQISESVIALPPLAEQHRIVTKVDELMVLCDRLEQQAGASLSAHQILVEALLNTLTSAIDHMQFAGSWQRIAEHFDTLFTTEESIDQLKQAILQLAVMGKLVLQDHSDESAGELLKAIATEKAKLVKEGKIKEGKQRPPISEREKPFGIPVGWELVRFGDLLINRDAERIPLSVDERAPRGGGYDYYGASGVIDSIDAYLFDKPLLLIGEDGANLINRSTPIAFMAYGKYWVNNHAHVLDGFSVDLLQYVCIYINAISLEPYVTGTAQPKMNQAKMNGIVVALPPLAEQRRIIAKVDELMGLCDQLRFHLNEAQTTQLHLADVLTEKALAGA
ncbi:MAG: restriction endonuclease subunit S [Hydrogenophaga sp.]|nr:restriction endonuclease subunit S [Hydrogenophaga sp.]